MRLVKVRECDGQCCKEGPRFPNADHTDCIYHDGKDERGCALMRGEASVPDEPSVIFPNRTALEVYKETCRDWPHNRPGRGTGGCCWQWVAD